jgi:hypothetical protein
MKMRIKKFNRFAAMKKISFDSGYLAGYCANPKLIGFHSEDWMRGYRRGIEDYRKEKE